MLLEDVSSSNVDGCGIFESNANHESNPTSSINLISTRGESVRCPDCGFIIFIDSSFISLIDDTLRQYHQSINQSIYPCYSLSLHCSKVRNSISETFECANFVLCQPKGIATGHTATLRASSQPN